MYAEEFAVGSDGEQRVVEDAEAVRGPLVDPDDEDDPVSAGRRAQGVDVRAGDVDGGALQPLEPGEPWTGFIVQFQ